MINSSSVDNFFSTFKRVKDFREMRPELPFRPEGDDPIGAEKTIFMQANSDRMFNAVLFAFKLSKTHKMDFDTYLGLVLGFASNLCADMDDDEFMHFMDKAMDEMAFYLLVAFNIPLLSDEEVKTNKEVEAIIEKAEEDEEDHEYVEA